MIDLERSNEKGKKKEHFELKIGKLFDIMEGISEKRDFIPPPIYWDGLRHLTSMEAMENDEN